MEKNTRIYRSTVVVMGMLLLSKVLGFLRQSVIAAVLGANTATDLYFIPNDFTTSITGAISQALVTSLVAVYVSVRARQGKEEANRSASRAMTICQLSALVISALLALFAPLIGRVLAPGYSGADLAVLVRYLRALSLVLLLTTAQAGYIAVLNAEGIFTPGKLYGLLLNPLAIAAVLLLGRKTGIGVLVYVTYLAQLIQLLILALRARKLYVWKPGKPEMDPVVRQFLLLMLPVTVCNVIMQFGVIGGKAICSLLGESIASSYTYAYSLEQMVTGTFTAALSATAFPRLAELAAREERQSLSDFLRGVLTIAVTLLLLVTIVMVISARDIVTLVYMRGAFTQENAVNTAMALCGFALGFPVVMCRELLRQVHFASKATKATMGVDVAGAAVSVVLAALLSRPFGVFGVAAAVSLGALCSVTCLCVSAMKRLGLPAFGPGWGEVLRCAGTLALSAMACGGVRLLLPGSTILRFFAGGAAGVLVFAAAILLLRPRSMDLLLEPLLERVRRK